MDWLAAAVLIVAVLVLFRFRPNPVWLLLAGGLLGWLARGQGIG